MRPSPKHIRCVPEKIRALSAVEQIHVNRISIFGSRRTEFSRSDKSCVALCHGRREHEALQRVQWTVRPNTLQAGSEKLLLKTVPGKIQGRRRAQSFPDQRVDGISRSKGLRSRQRIPQVNAMGQVLRFRCNDVFFPEVTVSMGEAYDAAIATPLLMPAPCFTFVSV
jgi:hypothetical protein